MCPQITQLKIVANVCDLYDFDYEAGKGGLGTEAAILQIGWDPNKNQKAGTIFLVRLYPIKEWNSWAFDLNAP